MYLLALKDCAFELAKAGKTIEQICTQLDVHPFIAQEAVFKVLRGSAHPRETGPAVRLRDQAAGPDNQRGMG